MGTPEHYGRERRARRLRDDLRATVLALAQRSAGSREYAAAAAEFARGRSELRREAEEATRGRLRRQAGKPAPWDSPRALARRLAAWDVADARWADWADRTILAARAGAQPPLAPGERRRSGAASGRLCRDSVFPPPGADAVRRAWRDARGGRGRAADAIRLGSVLLDLEASLDASVLHGPRGLIEGRPPGLRGWVAANAPDLAGRYDTLLRARRLAAAFRRACGLRDPLPASLLLDEAPAAEARFPPALRQRVARARAAARALLDSPAGRTVSALAASIRPERRPGVS